MQFPKETFGHPGQVDEAALLWDTRLLKRCLEARGERVSLRTIERTVNDLGVLPEPLGFNELIDENGKPLINLVRQQLEETARRKRQASLVVQLHRFEGRFVFMANDGRQGRRWAWLQGQPDITQLDQFLSALVASYQKPLVIWPQGEVTRLVKSLAERDGGYSIEINGIQVLLALTAYGEQSTQTQDAGVVVQSSPKSQVDQVLVGKEDSMEMTHLDRLEAESIHIIREVMAESENPVMLYSIGKDSSVMLRLAEKAFYPSKPPFPLLHVDTRWKFQAMYEFRSKVAEQTGMELLVHINPDGVARNMNPFDHGSSLHTDVMKTQGLKQALDEHGFDAAFGGARRDEEKSRAKERVFSFRTSNHRWDPKNQRPELWDLYNGRKNKGESIRVFPLSNWTEIDIWQYIYRENIPIVPLYYAAERPVIERDGMLMMVDDDRLKLFPGEKIQTKRVRFRTLGCYPLTGAVESEAETLPEILLELLEARTSERQGRAIDSDSSGSMEKKKQEGYF